MDLLLMLDVKTDVPLYTQVVNGITELIASSRLKPGSKLPSTRELSESLGVSRDTTSRAYDELSRLGYITVRSASGSFVSSYLPDALMKPSRPVSLPVAVPADAENEQRSLSQFGERIMRSRMIEPFDIELHPELNYGAATVDQLPLSKWREMLGKAARLQDLPAASYLSNPLGHSALREALAAYLMRCRGVRCGADQIVLFAGAQPALDLIARLFINAGDAVVLENPGFPGARRTFASHGARLHTVPVDERGLVVDKLSALPDGVKVAYVTPSHHDPSGVTLSLERRHKLLSWAREKGVLVVEDDFDSEFRYGEKPLPALQGMDRDDSVIYLSSFWKVLYPVLRLGFIVVPRSLVSVFQRAKSLLERDFQFIEHDALALFINEGHLERHIRKTRILYSKRREALVEKLNQRLGRNIKISPVLAGTHLLARLQFEIAPEEVVRCAAEAGLSLVSARGYYVENPVENEFLISFAHLNENAIAEAVEKFASLLPV